MNSNVLTTRTQSPARIVPALPPASSFRLPKPPSPDMNVQSPSHADVLSKVPVVTLGFWIIKILATTLGETGGDTVTMTMNLGYLTGTIIFLSALIIFVVLQIRARRFHPFLYWATIIASTTAGTTMADFADRSLGIGYAGGSALLLAALLVSFAVWYRAAGSVAVETVNSPRV